MADKLAESTWSGFTKKQGLKLEDGPLLKALAKFDKTDEAKPAPRVDALEEVVDLLKRQVVALAKKKKELGDKPFGLAKDKLDELLGLAESELKKSREAMSSAEDEADSPVLLTTKMLPIVKELRKGEARFPALVSSAGKDTAVLIMRKPIATTRRKLMQDYLDAQGGVKHISAEVNFEKGALTFHFASPAGGLAKRITAALLKQLELRLRVRVRGEDGEESDGEDGGEDQAGVQAQPPQAPPRGPASPAALEYTQRLNRLRPRYDEALREQHPESTKLRAVMGFASEKAALEDHAGAIKALQTLDKLLDASPGQGGAPGEGPSDTAKEFERRQAEVDERVQAALRAQHPEATKLRAVTAFASEKAAAGDYAGAMKALQMLEKLLETPIPEGQQQQQRTAPGDARMMLGRLQAVRDDAIRMGVAPQVAEALRDAATALKANDPKASALLDALEQRVAEIARAQRVSEAEKTIAGSQTEGGVGVVEFAKIRLAMQDARSTFEGAFDSLKSSFEALLETEDFVDDPRSSDPATLAAIDTLEQRLPSFPELAEKVDGALDDMMSAADPQVRKKHSDAALKAIADFRKRIDAEEILTEMESTEAGKFAIHSAMVASLDRMTEALTA